MKRRLKGIDLHPRFPLKLVEEWQTMARRSDGTAHASHSSWAIGELAPVVSVASNPPRVARVRC